MDAPSEPARKKRSRTALKETVIKCCLMKYIRYADQGVRQKIQDAIHTRVQLYSQRVNLASIALMTYLKQEAGAGRPLSEGIFSQTFMRQLLIGTNRAIVPNLDIQKLYESHPALLDGDVSFRGSRNVWSFGATRMLTCLKNSLSTNLVRRIRSFMEDMIEAEGRYKDYKEMSKEEETQKRKKLYGTMANLVIWGELLNPEDVLLIEPQDLDTVSVHRKLLGLAPLGTANSPIRTAYDLEYEQDRPATLVQILEYFVYLLKERERLALPLFNICPIFGNRHHFISIDTSALYGILREAGLTACTSGTAFEALGKEEWKAFLNLDKFRTSRGKEFTGTIDTDGVSLTVHFREAVTVSCDDDMSALPDVARIDLSKAKVMGLDPGRSNIYTIAVPVKRDSFEKHVLSRKRYYQESGTYEAEANTRVWSRGIQNHLDALSKVSSKGISMSSHMAYLEEYLARRMALFSEYSKRRWARQRMRLYACKRQCIDRFLSDVRRSCAAVSKERDPRIIMAYGAAGFSSGAKREPSVPTKWALKMCQRHFETYMVDEFRTSRVNYKDDSLLKSVRSEATDRGVRGLLWCESTIPGKGKFVDRDLNAAINIRRCFVQERLTGARPEALCRATCAAMPNRRLPIRAPVGRVIKA